MISSDQGTAEMIHFLNIWYLNSKIVLHKELFIHRVEIDYSWALIHRTCIAFNKMKILGYLESCWKIVSTDGGSLGTLSVIHLCSAHIMHRISHNLTKTYKIDKNFKQLIQHVFAAILRSITMREIDRLFTLLCIVLSNEYSNEIVNSSLVELNALVTGKIELQQENVVNFEDDYEPSDNSITYRLKSPFGRHFDILKRNNCARSKIFKGNKLVTCYSLEILEYLLTYYMPIIPLWTGVILSKSCDESKASFCASAENWFRIVKHPILETKVNVTAGDFIRTTYDNIHDRISAFNFGFHPLAPKIFKSRKRKLEIQNEDSKEKWFRRSKCQKSYINPNLCRVDKVFEAINVVN